MLRMSQETLRGAENMPGWKKRNARVAREHFSLLVGENVFHPVTGQARLHQSRGPFGTEDFAMVSDMIRMGVRNKRSRDREMSIEPPP